MKRKNGESQILVGAGKPRCACACACCEEHSYVCEELLKGSRSAAPPLRCHAFDAEPLEGSCCAHLHSYAYDLESDDACDHNKEVEAPWHLVLERLSVRKQCQVRGVSKAWNFMLGGGNSHRFCKEVEEECCFVMVRPPKHGQDKWKFMAYSNHSTDPFFRPPLPNASHRKLFSLLGGEDCCRLARRVSDMRQHPPIVDNLQLQSAGGLMTAMVRRPDGYDIIIFNFVTGSVEVLPPPLDGDKPFIGDGCCFNMSPDSHNPGCFFIMLTPDIMEPDYFEIFESRNGCWKGGRKFIHASFSSDLKVVDGDFVWLLSTPECSRNRLVAYHVVHDAWSSLYVPADPDSPYLHKYGGRLFLSLSLEAGNGTSHGFGVWELRLTSGETGTWVEVARTPEHLWQPLRSRTWDYRLYADGSLFWMTRWKRNHNRSFRPPLVFDMAKMFWYSLPLEKTSRKFGCILVHRPSFHAGVSPLQEG